MAVGLFEAINTVIEDDDFCAASNLCDSGPNLEAEFCEEATDLRLI
jgi:hypothetical protein